MKSTASAIAAISLAILGASPASVADHLSAMDYYLGTWTCTFESGGQRLSFTASYSRAVSDNWIREVDTWSGDGDETSFTYDRSTGVWTEVVLDSGRGTTVFQAKEAGASPLTFRSVYPDATISVVFERKGAKRYVVRFTQTKGANVIKSTDTCTRR